MNRMIRTILERRYSAVFFLIILSVLFVRVKGTGEKRDLREKKAPSIRSVFAGREMHEGLKQYRVYFEKTFPFRQELLSWRNYFYVRYLGISPVDKVIAGKENWLYLKRLNRIGSKIDFAASVEKFREGELESWFGIFNERYRYLKEKDIRFLLVIVPNKSTVYPEYLPESVRKVTGGVRADQLTEYFREHSDMAVINLRETMQNLKKERLLYQRTDTHWNFYGAWAGYREIIRYLSGFFPGAETVRFEDFQTRDIRGVVTGDLASMLSFRKYPEYRETSQRVFPPKGVKVEKKKLRDFNYPKIRTGYFKYKDGRLPKTLVVHDSFGNRLRTFLSVSFSEIIFLWDWGFNFFPELIEREKPSIVIYEMAERFLYRPVPGSGVRIEDPEE